MTAARHALKTGAALAITVALAYAVCTLAFWLFPQASASFITALFHGVDLTTLQDVNAPFSFGGTAYALGVISVWAFAVGALFEWLRAKAFAS